MGSSPTSSRSNAKLAPGDLLPDTILLVGLEKEPFEVEAGVLAASSERFRDLLSGGQAAETPTRTISLPEVDAEAFRAILGIIDPRTGHAVPESPTLERLYYMCKTADYFLQPSALKPWAVSWAHQLDGHVRVRDIAREPSEARHDKTLCLAILVAIFLCDHEQLYKFLHALARRVRVGRSDDGKPELRLPSKRLADLGLPDELDLAPAIEAARLETLEVMRAEMRGEYYALLAGKKHISPCTEDLPPPSCHQRLRELFDECMTYQRGGSGISSMIRGRAGGHLWDLTPTGCPAGWEDSPSAASIDQHVEWARLVVQTVLGRDEDEDDQRFLWCGEAGPRPDAISWCAAGTISVKLSQAARDLLAGLQVWTGFETCGWCNAERHLAANGGNRSGIKCPVVSKPRPA